MADKWPAKDPNERLDYSIDWHTGKDDKPGPLQIDNDTISASTWVVPSGLTQDPDFEPSFSATVTTIWLKGGTAGQKYSVVNRIETVGGRIHDKTISLSVKEL